MKLAPPPSLAIADASAEHAQVVLVAVQLTGVQSVESYVCSAAFQRRHEGSTVTAQLICVDHSSDTSTSIPGLTRRSCIMEKMSPMFLGGRQQTP